MWRYEKKLQYPVRIKKPNPMLAKVIISQYGGPNGGIIEKKKKTDRKDVNPHGLFFSFTEIPQKDYS